MKKLFSSLLTIALLLAAAIASAQAPQGVNYQAVVRDGSGNLITSGTVNMRFTILQGSSSGTSVYQETQSVAPISYGLVNVVIGSGNIVLGSFPGIGWGSSSYYLKVEADPTGGNNFAALGNPTQFQSVPYALNAGNGNWALSSGNIYNTNTGGYVGIGTATPTGPLNISCPIYGASFNVYDFQPFGGQVEVAEVSSPNGPLFRLYGGTQGKYMDLGVDSFGDFTLNNGGTGSTVLYVDQNTSNVGIGTASPNYTLEVQSSTEYAIWGATTESNGNGVSGIANTGSFAYALYGESSSGYGAYISGNLYYSGTISGPSDARLKENIQPIGNAISRLQQLVPSSYTFKKEYSKMNLPKGTQFGFIAQDMEKVFPELVVTNYDKNQVKDGVFEFKSINYVGMVPVLTEAILEQQKQIDELKALVQKLTTK